MSGNDNSVVGGAGSAAVGGGTPGPGGGGGPGTNSSSASLAEPITRHIFKTIPIIAPLQPTTPITSIRTPIKTCIRTSSIRTTTQTSYMRSPTSLFRTPTATRPILNSPINIKGIKTLTTLRPVAAKITHVKTASIDTSSLMAGGTIKVAASGGPTSSLTGTPISINSGQSTTAASIRAIGAGGQSTQVRVVMPTGIMPQSMIKQLEGATATGRTQITAIPAAMPARTVSNASITVTRPITQATYLPRAGVTSTQMTGVGMATGQRLVTPLRATTSVTPTASGLTAAGSFVRGTAVSRSTVSQPSTVISSATNTAWMTSNSSGQVQLIRTIPQSRQRIITTQGITTTGAAGNLGGASGGSASGNAMTTTATQAQIAQAQPGNSVASAQSSGHTQQQPQYVAVLPQRQHQATLVYSNVGGAPTSQPLSQPQFNTTMSTSQRFAVATPISGGSASTSTATTRQIRPIPIGKSFSTTKLNTTSISIRAPSIPQLTSTMASGAVVSSGAPTITAAPTVVATPTRNTTGGVSGSVSGANMLTTANLPTTRIIQLQQPTSGATQQIIGSAGRLATNVMLQPIIVNTSSGNKIGIRPPVTMTAKVQPSLTITQLGTIGKMPTGGSSSTSLTPQGMAASIQSISGNSGNSSSSIVGSVSGGSTITNTATGATQLVNVSQASQLLSAGSVVSSASGTPGGATVVPLAITTRGGSASNILTGTITPIKNANGITVGKMMTQTASAGVLDSSNVSGGTGNPPTSVFIHQRPGSNSSSSLNTGSGVTVSVSNTGSATPVVTSSAANAFLPAGSTIYYESMPANSVQVSTGVLSLTTTTVSQSTMSQAQMVNSGGNLAISSLPFVTHAGGSTTTFTVVPSSAGGRTIGQLQLPNVSNSGAQLQAVPVRLSTTQPVGSNAEMNSTAQLLQTTPGGQQLIIPTGQAVGQQQQHMVIPLQTSVKVTTGVSHSANSSVSGGVPITSTMVSNFLRKRDAEGSPIRAAKNLAPTLLSMSSNNAGNSNNINTASIVGVPSPAGSSISSSSYSLNSVQMTSTSSNLTTEALAKKDRAAAAAGASTISSRAGSPGGGSSDGSTTVSANSSPGVDQQIQDNNMVINRMHERNNENSATHFNPINELYPNHHHSTNLSQNIPAAPVSSRSVAVVSMDSQQQLQGTISSVAQLRINGGPFELMRKKSRRSTNDSQHSVHSHASLTLPPPTGTSISSGSLPTNATTSSEAYTQNGLLLTANVKQDANAASVDPAEGSGAVDANSSNQTNNHVNNVNAVPGNKENAKPLEFVLRRPRNCTLINAYKQSHKLANNHFLRYSDVKPRDDRRPTIMDLANQSHVIAKINGWKIYHLRSQMEDMVENETSFYSKMEEMLKKIEKEKEKNQEFERINELIKGNMQRSKIVADGVNEAQNQLMKIFDHKAHVADIITRCASKRNFKKREKV